MILVLDDGHQVDSKDTEAMEKAASIQEQEALEAEAVAAEALDKSAEKGELTPEKAKKILKDGQVHGKPLTDQQRKYFGAVAGGTARKSEAGESMASIEALEEFAKAGPYIGPRGGKWADAKHTVPWTKEAGKREHKVVGEYSDPSAAHEKAMKMKQQGWGNIRIKKEGGKHVLSGTAPAEKPSAAKKPAKKQEAEKPKGVVARETEMKEEVKKFGPKISEALKTHALADEYGEKKFGARVSPVSIGGMPKIQIHLKAESPSKSASLLLGLAKELGFAEKFDMGGAPKVVGSAAFMAIPSGTLKQTLERIQKEVKKPSKGGKEAMTIEDAVRAEAEADRTATRMAIRADNARGIIEGAKAAGLPENEIAVLVAEADKAAKADKAAEAAYDEATRVLAEKKKETTAKSLDSWLTEQETDMTNETELLKALGDDAELVKGMMVAGYGGKHVLEWANQFYQDTGLEKDALQCVKDKIACQKRWDAHHKAAKPWREVEDMPRKAREAYRDKQSKAREVISKEEGAVHMKMRDLEEKLVDYRIKQASMRQAMGKGGFETLDDFAKSESDAVDVEVVKNESGTSVLVSYLEKAQGMPGMEHGPEDSADLSLVQPIVEPVPGKKKPIERITGKSMSVAGHQRELVAHENAQVVSALRKGPADITLGPGVPTPQREPEPVVKSTHRVQGDDSLLIYGDGSDEAASRLAKGDDFWSGGNAPTIGCNPMILNQRKRCAACKAVMSKSLAVCPHCGDGAGIPRQGAVRIATGAVRNGPTLQPARGEQDITIV